MDNNVKSDKKYVTGIINNKQYYWYAPSAMSLWRYNTLLEKEPWTIEWINSFDQSDILWDIGANIGIYSIYAAVSKGVRVFAFEPESANYRILNENIRLNRVQDLVKGYCLAISDTTGFTQLELTDIEPGSSGHQIRRIKKPVFKQGCVSYRMDDMYDFFGSPTHIKIDVDGFEPKVIAGGLQNILPKVKSVIVETCSRKTSHASIFESLLAQGFKWHPEVAERSVHKDGQYKDIGEHLFSRQ